MAASEWMVISEHELVEPRAMGGWIRAYCQCHHDNCPPTLSINPDSGFGGCFRCKAKVLVREFNPNAAENIARSSRIVTPGTIYVRDPRDIAKFARIPKQGKERSIESWQVEELKLLGSLQNNMQSRIGDERAHAYLKQRGISVETAERLGVGYIPDIALQGKYWRIAKWADHIVFPVQSPDGIQYVGRSLRLWTPGMDECQHKQLLESKEQELLMLAKASREHDNEAEEKRLQRESRLYLRWYKTHSNGWFNYQALQSSLESTKHVVFCEGAFDALALVEAGIENAIAIIGTALESSWIPAKCEHVTLAFDGDNSGIEASGRARDDLYERGYDVTLCHVPDDGKGKDWSERYRLHGRDGLTPLLNLIFDNPVATPITQVEELSEHCSICGKSVYETEEDFYYSSNGKLYCSGHYEVGVAIDKLFGEVLA